MLSELRKLTELSGPIRVRCGGSCSGWSLHCTPTDYGRPLRRRYDRDRIDNFAQRVWNELLVQPYHNQGSRFPYRLIRHTYKTSHIFGPHRRRQSRHSCRRYPGRHRRRRRLLPHPQIPQQITSQFPKTQELRERYTLPLPLRQPKPQPPRADATKTTLLRRQRRLRSDAPPHTITCSTLTAHGAEPSLRERRAFQQRPLPSPALTTSGAKSALLHHYLSFHSIHSPTIARITPSTNGAEPAPVPRTPIPPHGPPTQRWRH